MIKYLQLPFYFDVQKMQEEVRSLGRSDWQLHYQVKHYEGDWTGLPLRSIGGNPGNVMIAPTNDIAYADTVFLENSPYLKQVLEKFRCPLQAVRLLKITPGTVIKEHRDAELYFEKGEVRFHIPVMTNDKVEFYLDKERMMLKEGECWYMNFNLPHSIVNNSGADRVHLVIDAEVNDWVKELFEKSTDKKEIAEPGYDAATRRQIIEHLRQLNTPAANKMADEMEASG